MTSGMSFSLHSFAWCPPQFQLLRLDSVVFSKQHIFVEKKLCFGQTSSKLSKPSVCCGTRSISGVSKQNRVGIYVWLSNETLSHASLNKQKRDPGCHKQLKGSSLKRHGKLDQSPESDV